MGNFATLACLHRGRPSSIAPGFAWTTQLVAETRVPIGVKRGARPVATMSTNANRFLMFTPLEGGRATRPSDPVTIDAFVVLPDPVHAIWTLPTEEARCLATLRLITNRLATERVQ